MSLFSCFDSVVGVSRNPDLCVTGSYDTDSLSGLYLDELPGTSLRILDSVGGNTSLVEKMEYARENAINAFKIDVMKEILKTKEPARPRFIGDIGGKSFTSVMSADTYHGLRMYSDILGGTFVLRGVTLMLDVTEAVTLQVFSEPEAEDGGAELTHFHLTSLSDKRKYTAVTPTTFDLEGDLYFLFTTTGQPYNNKLTCNCGGFKWCFNIEHPCYRYSRDKWTEWAMVGGTHGSDLTIRDDWGTTREARGIILHGDFNCDSLGILCSDHSNWTENVVDQAIASAIVYKAGSFLSTYIMDSEEVNRFTLLGIDQLGANIAFYEQSYVKMIEFIGANIEDDRNECLKCRSPHGYKRQSQIL